MAKEYGRITEIERSIIKTYRKELWAKFVRAIDDYELISEGDKICVCISGGKDSMILAKLFQELHRHTKFPFEVEFLMMNPGYNKENLDLIMYNLSVLNIPAHIVESNIFEVANSQEKNPCYLCARMRRGVLYKAAKELGCNKTHFITPNGLDAVDEGGIHATTATELAIIMRYCIKESEKKDDFLTITRTPSYQFKNVKGDRNFSCTNRNAFLSMMEGALSGKTGFTGKAGYCYVGALERDGKSFIVALLACGWPNNKNYKWSDTKVLMEYGIEQYEYQNVYESIKLPKIRVNNGVPNNESLFEICK